MWRSVMAIVVGFLFIGLFVAASDAVLRTAMPGAFDATGRMTSTFVLVLTLAYVGVFAVAGCYLAARLAPNHPMRHALILGVLGLIFNIVGSYATWHIAPAWYHVVAIALVMPYAWLGGRIRERQLEHHPSGPTPLAA